MTRWVALCLGVMTYIGCAPSLPAPGWSASPDPTNFPAGSARLEVELRNPNQYQNLTLSWTGRLNYGDVSPITIAGQEQDLEITTSGSQIVWQPVPGDATRYHAFVGPVDDLQVQPGPWDFAVTVTDDDRTLAETTCQQWLMSNQTTTLRVAREDGNCCDESGCSFADGTIEVGAQAFGADQTFIYDASWEPGSGTLTVDGVDGELRSNTYPGQFPEVHYLVQRGVNAWSTTASCADSISDNSEFLGFCSDCEPEKSNGTLSTGYQVRIGLEPSETTTCIFTNTWCPDPDIDPGQEFTIPEGSFTRITLTGSNLAHGATVNSPAGPAQNEIVLHANALSVEVRINAPGPFPVDLPVDLTVRNSSPAGCNPADEIETVLFRVVQN